MMIGMQIINGLQQGSIYALVALGYTMVYGIIQLLNFAHGDIIMAGAYVCWIIMVQLGLPVYIAVVLAPLACMVLGILIDKIAYAPLRSSSRLSLLITAIGVSYFLENAVQLIFGADSKVLGRMIDTNTIDIVGFPVSVVALITIALTALGCVALTLLVQKTKLGCAMRAVSEDMQAAQLMGVNVNTIISVTFALGSLLAGVGSVLYCMAYTQAYPTMGVMLGTKAFCAAVLGGIGSIPGAVLGGFVVGFAEVIVSALGLSLWKDAVVFLLLIAILVFKPSGILGTTTKEKV